MGINNTETKVIIFINSEQKGFLIALAYCLETYYNIKVVIVARDKYVMHLVKQLLPDREGDIVLHDYVTSIDIDETDVVNRAITLEKDYSVKFSTLLAEDRALGQGYLMNVENIPDIIRASWSYKAKLVEYLRRFLALEKVLIDVKFVIQLWPDKSITSIGSRHGFKSFSFVPMKFGDRRFWSDDDYITSSVYINRLKNNLEHNQTHHIREYEIDGAGNMVNKSVNFSYFSAIKKALRVAFNDTKNLVRGMQKKDSYHYLGWVPSIFRKIYNYNFVKKHAIMPDDISDYKIVYFTLHMEPEVALQYFSPEFSNSMEAITWISKSLPAGYLLVVKEQVNSYGVRSKWYYKQLLKMPNVMLSNPNVHSWDWIKYSDIVATITGSVGQEAIHFEKPVLSFGKHQIINYLPTVRYVSNYNEVNMAVNDFIGNVYSQSDFVRAKNTFANSQFESSVDMPRYKYTLKSENLEQDMAKDALSNLFSEYPELLEAN